MGSDAIDRDWKEGHLRIGSDPVVDRGSGSKSDNIELPDRTHGRSNKGPGGRRFPRLGLDALFHESRPSQDLTEDGTVEFFKVYKRRWFGLAQLTLLNIVVSWDVSLISSKTCLVCLQGAILSGDITRVGVAIWHWSRARCTLGLRGTCNFVGPQHRRLMQCSREDGWRRTVPASRNNKADHSEYHSG